MGRELHENQPTRLNHSVGSDHLLPTEYQPRPDAEKSWLKYDAVPSVFPFHPPYLRLQTKT